MRKIHLGRLTPTGAESHTLCGRPVCDPGMVTMYRAKDDPNKYKGITCLLCRYGRLPK